MSNPAPGNTSSATIPNVLSDELRALLETVATATITAQLHRRGIRNSFLSGLRPLLPNQRLVGRARTLRYVAVRQDILDAAGPEPNPQRASAEATEPGDVLVIEARNVPDAGTVGDIYASRIYALGGVGIITDGALRDTGGIATLGKPVYHRSSHGSTWRRRHMPLTYDEPITCAEVYVEPGDVVVGDDEGAVVIPMALVDEVARACVAQEEREAFALERVQAGAPTNGIFPLSEEYQAEFEAWKAARAGQ
ncbi:MAG: hypothetical protein OER95_01195 [Acidimicrobiia bacterium]|nr:hypothetical protein [Acidimicrobiia bacterium]